MQRHRAPWGQQRGTIPQFLVHSSYQHPPHSHLVVKMAPCYNTAITLTPGGPHDYGGFWHANEGV